MTKSSSSSLGEDEERAKQQQQQLSLVDFVLSALRKSMASTCRVDRPDQEVVSAVGLRHMEIGWPTDVQHLTHVTFDRFHGFLGLPLEFELEIPPKPPSASASVCGVSAESMQWSYDGRGNTVPTILLLMQQKLYSHGGLKVTLDFPLLLLFLSCLFHQLCYRQAEGIFRINPENSQEEYVRDQLNRGIVPEDIDVHCLAGLIKAWFRELPSGVLDGLSPEQVSQCNTEEECVELIKQLKPTEKALLAWAIDLMADVVEQEGSNKMNARNIAMVFAPNMTQVLNPVTALEHAVQVMNLLKTLILKRLKDREGAGGADSSRPSRFSDGEYDGQRETDASYELVGRDSEDEEQQDYYSSCNEDKDEVESLSEIEYCFLRQLDDSESAKDGFRKQLERILCREHPSPVSNNSSLKADSHVHAIARRHRG
ncbi:rho GTPase-activating protein 2-like isoform X2 [Andrographis paniculata]|uniref:rho GTPase-activating protein 2-like isoform X2 n=1 Tax=Andrographis paniculata TaxID=175694 RepID=UPI0021E74616|nr:rho GTPase-activating protein 2-like isoform X2 [Andrographis paniculata]